MSRVLPHAARHVVRHAFLAVLIGPAVLTVAVAGGHPGGHAHAHSRPADDAIGVPGVAARVDRTITIDMTDDMRFKPAEIAVRRGETVRFALRNAGQLKHELVLGTEQELKDHDAAMARDPEMAHADPKMLTLAPGRSGEIVWRFTKGGRVDFACLQPGHFAAGMKGWVKVAAGLAGMAAAPRDVGASDAIGSSAPAAVLARSRPGEKAPLQPGSDDGRFVVARSGSPSSR